MKTLLLFVLTGLIYMALDLVFINVLAKDLIQREISHLLAPKPDLIAAVTFYVIFIAGILYFCVWPAQTAGKALFNGAFLGLIAYATYELVNKSLLNNWSLTLVIVDIAWGVFVGAVVSWAGWMIGRQLGVL
jgi:uncharacterized membrane protein